jgi:predicted Zn-dependent peptidase
LFNTTKLGNKEFSIMTSSRSISFIILSFFLTSLSYASVKSYKHTYKNGLTLHYTENKSQPNFYAAVVVNVGGKEGPREFTGLAHYLEHLLFKGNHKVGSIDYEKEKEVHNKIIELYEQKQKIKDPLKRQQYDSEINKLSLIEAKYGNATEFATLSTSIGNEVINAYTSDEQTVYTTEFPSNKFQQWAEFEAERYKNPIFRTFQWELEIVYEEKNISLSQAPQIASQKISEALYPGHNYSNVLGEIEHLKNPSIKAVYDFFNKYYIANNMAVIISGDLDFEEVKATVGRRFSYLKRRIRPNNNQEIKDTDLKDKVVLDINKVSDPVVYIGFKTPGRQHRDHYVLQVIDMLMNNSTAGLIDLNIVNNQVLSSAGSFPRTLSKDSGIQFFYGKKSNSQTYDFVEKVLLAELEKIKQGQFSEELLKSVVQDLKKGHMSGLESNESRVRVLSDHFSYKSDGQVLNNYGQQLEKVTKKRIIEVANTYFNKNYAVARIHNKKSPETKIEKPIISPLPEIQYPDSVFAKELKAKPSKPIKAQSLEKDKDYQIHTFNPDSSLVYTKNPVNDLASLSVSFKRGYMQIKNAGFWSFLYPRFATQDQSSASLASAFYKLGIARSLSVYEDKTILTIEGPRENIEKGLELSLKTLFSPIIDQSILDKQVTNILESRALNLNKVDYIKDAASDFLTKRKNSSYLNYATNSELKKIKIPGYNLFSKSLKEVSRNYTYTGNDSLKNISKMLEKNFTHKGLDKGDVSQKTRPKHIEKSRLYFYHFTNSKQANIYFYKPGPVYQHKNANEQVKGRVFNQYWGASGLNSQMAIEIREKRALAYGAHAVFRNSRGQLNIGENTYYYGYIGTQMDKLDDALKAYQYITSAEYQHSNKSIQSAIDIKKIKMDTSRISHWSIPSYIHQLKRYDLLDAKFEEEERKAFKNMTVSDIQQTINERLVEGHTDYFVIGNKDLLDLDKLKDQFEFIELSKEDILPSEQ